MKTLTIILLIFTVLTISAQEYPYNNAVFNLEGLELINTKTMVNIDTTNTVRFVTLTDLVNYRNMLDSMIVDTVYTIKKYIKSIDTYLYPKVYASNGIIPDKLDIVKTEYIYEKLTPSLPGLIRFLKETNEAYID